MSYQQTYRAVSTPIHQSSYDRSPRTSISRKPANYPSSLRSVSPLPPSNIQTSASSSHVHSPTPLTPLNSNPTRPDISPAVTPDILANHQLRPKQEPEPDRPLYASPTSTTANHNLPAPRSQPQINGAMSTLSTTVHSNTKPLTSQEIDDCLRTCLRIQSVAVHEHSKRPFAALLLGPDNVTVLASHNSISHYQHAESELARLAAMQFGQEYLGRCTLVSTWEPCAMCAGTIYWTGIGRVLYAASESKLKELSGSNNPENMTMSLPCRTIFDAGQRKVDVVGPVPSWEEKVVEDAGKWWREHQGGSSNVNGFARSNGSFRDNASIHSKRTSVTIYNPEDSLLGSIGEDGEYQADLKIDWMP